MRIQLTGLLFEPQTFTHHCPAEHYLGGTQQFTENISICATVQMEGNSLRLNIEAELPGHFICDRCGRKFNRIHHCREHFYFSFEESDTAEDEQDIGVIPKGARELDISQEIRDMVLLALPSKLLCSEECLGLCPICGTDLNRKKCNCKRETFDPRWEALLRLKRGNSDDL